MTTTSFGNDNHGIEIGNNTGTVNIHSSPPGDKPVDVCRRRALLTDPEVGRDTVKCIKGQRATGTCEWIRENRIYISWLKGDSPYIWISVGPGRGKTMLSLFLIEELEKEAQEFLQHCNMVLFYICNY
jgi:Cdc6-like AAA superfamily ATPase